jgi:hypothetical protein
MPEFRPILNHGDSILACSFGRCLRLVGCLPPGRALLVSWPRNRSKPSWLFILLCLTSCLRASLQNTSLEMRDVTPWKTALAEFVTSMLREPKPDERAYLLLSDRWRNRLSRDQFFQDFSSTALAREKCETVQRIIKSGSKFEVTPTEAVLDLGQGHRAVLILENSQWHVDLIE